MYTVRDSLKTMKNNVSDLYKKVKQTEEKISNKISSNKKKGI